MKKFLNQRGETLIEVLLAIMILLIGVISVVKLFESVAINRQIIKERIIATNLAREALEATRNLRDTNWLRFAGEKRKCWNNNFPTSCDGNNPILPDQSYRILFDESYRFILEGISGRLELEDGAAANENYRLKINSAGLYNHEDGENSVFFREIYTEYLDQQQNPISDASASTANILRLTAKVAWQNRGKIQDVVLTTILTDHLNRRNHD